VSVYIQASRVVAVFGVIYLVKHSSLTILKIISLVDEAFGLIISKSQYPEFEI